MKKGNILKIFCFLFFFKSFFCVCFFSYVTDLYGYEHPAYIIQASIDDQTKSIFAHQKVLYTNNSQDILKEIYFHIYPNRHYTFQEINFMLRFAGYFKVNPYPEGFQQTSFKIQNIKSQEKFLDYSIEGEDKTLLKVLLPEPLLPGQCLTIQMDFSLNIPHAYGRLGWHQNIIQLSRWYPILSVYDQKGWHLYPFYPYHRPFFCEAATYTVELTVPQKMVVVHSGKFKEQKKIQKDTKLLKIQSMYPLREFSLALSPDYQMVSEMFQGVEIRSYYLKGDAEYGQFALQNAKDAMAFFTKRLGAYPYSQFSIVPVYLAYGGEQMSNMIFLDTRIYKLPKLLVRYFDFLISHETGHQWFYNLIGIDEYTQMWLEEGINSFFISEYLEEKYGENGQAADIVEFPPWLKDKSWLFPELTFQRTRDFRYKTITRQGYDHPVLGKLSSFAEPSSIFTITYSKGSQIVKMLKALIGEAAFDAVFKQIYEDYRFLNFDIKEFQEICEQHSDKDLEDFFHQWLSSKDFLDYTIKDVQENKIVIKNRGDIDMPIKIKIDYSDGHQEDIVWEKAQQNGFLLSQYSAPIQNVRLDPDEDLLDIDLTNNSWPRQLHFFAVPVYWGIYDISLFLPEDGYNIVLGPDIVGSGMGIKMSWQKPYDQIYYVATNFEVSESLHQSRTGYQLRNLWQKPITLGIEMANVRDYEDGDDDRTSGKIYIRRELWPAQYGLFDINDHFSFYLIRNQKLNERGEFLSGAEHEHPMEYSRKNESILGLAFSLNRSGPYPDEVKGYRLHTFFESAGHFLGAHKYFYRSGIDFSLYHPVLKKATLAWRIKYCWGYPENKILYHIGGIDGLRGYARKSIQGANAFISNIEYRFPLMEDLDLHFFDNVIGLDQIEGVVFFDAGQAWYTHFDEVDFKKDVGLGLRLKMNIGSFLEKVVFRLDIAEALHESKEDTQFWFGIHHAF